VPTETWKQQFPANSPPAKPGGIGGLMAYDEALGQMVLVSRTGTWPHEQLQNWTYNGKNWVRQVPTGSLLYGGSLSSLAYDPNIRKLVLVITAGRLTATAQTWTYDGKNWVRQFPAANPLPGSSWLAYDPAIGKLVLLVRDTKPATTWTYDGSTWSQQHPTFSPAVDGPMAYDPKLGEIVKVASVGYGPGDGMTWTYDGDNWTERAALSLAWGQADFSMAFDPHIGQMIVFGGRYSVRELQYWNTTSAFGGSKWTTLQPQTSPSPRGFAGLAYDPAIGQMLLFGGEAWDSTTQQQHNVNDTWTFQVLRRS
jgi:hypothetical protein